MNESTAPRSFLIIGILALVWNLVGVASFLMTATMSPEAIAELPAEQQPFYRDVPMLVTAVYAIATIGGLLGCIALLMKKAVAFPLFILSLAGVVVQFAYAFGMTNYVEVMGPSSLGLPALVFAIAAFLAWYSMSARSHGWIS